MSIQTVWDNEEGSIIRFQLEGKWTWDELYAANQQAYAMIEESTQQGIAMIVDVRGTKTLPDGALHHARTIFNRPLPPNALNLTILVGANTFMQAFYNMLKRLLPNGFLTQVMLVQDIDEARRIIQARRAELIAKG